MRHDQHLLVVAFLGDEMANLFQRDVPASQSEAVGDWFLLVVDAYYNTVAMRNDATRRLGGPWCWAAAIEKTNQ
jgi:hypothetical protein